MITRNITVSDTNDFSEYISRPLVSDDVQAYKIIFNTSYDLTDCVATLTAKRADDTVLDDVGTVSGQVATYILKNSIYSVSGELSVRLLITSSDGSTLTNKELIFEVIASHGESDAVAEDESGILNAFQSHIANHNNPHDVTAAQIGLETAAADIEAMQATIGTESLETTAQTLAGAVNEVNSNYPINFVNLNLGGSLIGETDTTNHLCKFSITLPTRYFSAIKTKNCIIGFIISSIPSDSYNYSTQLIITDGTDTLTLNLYNQQGIGIPKNDLVAGNVYHAIIADAWWSESTTVAYVMNGAEILSLENKVDAVSGKGLSTNDFTDAYVAQLNSLASSTVVELGELSVSGTIGDLYCEIPLATMNSINKTCFVSFTLTSIPELSESGNVLKFRAVDDSEYIYLNTDITDEDNFVINVKSYIYVTVNPSKTVEGQAYCISKDLSGKIRENESSISGLTSYVKNQYNSTAYSTGKKWIDGSVIYRKDFVWKITGLTAATEQEIWLNDILDGYTRSDLLIVGCNLICQDGYNVSNLYYDTTYMFKVTPIGTEIIVSGYFEYVVGDYSTETSLSITNTFAKQS